MITEHKTVYRTTDGKLFVSESEAKHHEDWNINSLAIDKAIHTATLFAGRKNFGEYVRADSPSFRNALINEILSSGFRRTT